MGAWKFACVFDVEVAYLGMVNASRDKDMSLTLITDGYVAFNMLNPSHKHAKQSIGTYQL